MFRYIADKALKTEIIKTIRLAIPIVLGQVGQMAFGVMDNIMVGRLGTLELAACGFANMVTAIPIFFLVGVASGISVTVAQAYGSGRFEDCGAYLVAGLTLTLGFIGSMVAFYLYGPDFLPWFKQPDEVLFQARPYFELIAWSLIPMVLFQGFRQFTLGLEKAIWPTLILFSALGLNFILNWAFIFGNFGAPELGLYGAGVATTVSRVWMAVSLFLLIWISPEFSTYRPSRFSFKKRHFRPVSKVGLTSGVQYLFEVGAFTAAGFMSGWISTQALAAHQVAINIGAITFMFAWGICFATSVRVGQAHGRHESQLAKTRGLIGVGLVVLVMGLFGLLIATFRKDIPLLYLEDPEVHLIASQLLLVCAIFQIFDGVQAVAMGALRGISDVFYPSIFTAIIYWGFTIPCSYFLAFPMGYGATGLWLGLGLGLGLAASAMLARFVWVLSR